jgi:uncharacterized protein involved in type VI secretion and phage assembly
VSTFVGVMSEVARRELATHRSLALGVVTESFSNGGGKGEIHLACHVRLHGSELVLQHVPVAVARPGFSALPRKGDLVVVGFLDGDVNGPVLLGTLHAAGVPSPDAKVDEVVYVVPDAEGSARRFEVELPNGNKITIKDSTVTVAMGGTSITVESGGNITMQAGGDISLKADGDITMEAKGNLKLEALANADLKASANATVEASANATLKGAMTSIAGMTSFKAG